jgi:hypothetical protein
MTAGSQERVRVAVRQRAISCPGTTDTFEYPEDTTVNTSPLKAREVEALTFIYSAPEPVTGAQRSRSLGFLDWVWGMLRGRAGRPSSSGDQRIGAPRS